MRREQAARSDIIPNPSLLSIRGSGSTARDYGCFRLPAPGRGVLEEPPPDDGVEGVPPEPVDVPPTDGVAAGLGVGRSEGVPGVAAPVSDAAGVPGFAPLLDGGVGCEVGARFRISWAAPVKVRGEVDVAPGVAPEPVRPAIGDVPAEEAPYAGDVGPEPVDV
jgi:hypothetical protein